MLLVISPNATLTLSTTSANESIAVISVLEIISAILESRLSSAAIREFLSSERACLKSAIYLLKLLQILLFEASNSLRSLSSNQPSKLAKLTSPLIELQYLRS